MIFSVLTSGSKGNCALVQAGTTRILLDCGGSKRYLKQCFNQLQLELDSIDAILITHDHQDHVGALSLFHTTPTVFAPYALEDRDDVQVLMPYMMHRYQALTIFPLVLSHDSALTYGYVIEHQDERLVYITDTGYLKSKDYAFIQGAQYYILESNHDVDLLMKSRRPYATKQRILSDTGHLSNDAASLILAQVVTPATRAIVLAHLSEEANREDLAIKAVWEALRTHRTEVNANLSIRCARQKEMTLGGQSYEESPQHQHHLAFAHLE
jgi:phosphoribosyl 1,2-cyclic phosphodiesterase